MASFKTLLPAQLVERATLRGNELAWPINDIPEVIEAAKLADLVSIGGQLQLRIPGGGTCECYWVQVDTFKSVSPNLPWHERVELTASAARMQFEELLKNYDFIAEVRSAFGRHVDEFEASGGKPNDALCFVWSARGEHEVTGRA